MTRITEIRCNYVGVPNAIKKLRFTYGYDITEITKERISPCDYIVTGVKKGE